MTLLTKDRSFYKEFFSMVFYIVLQNLIVFSVNLADNIMLGAYSQDALSGVALANQVQFVLQMLIGGVGEGVVVIAAQYWGKRQTEPIKRVLSLGVWGSLLLGAAFMMVGMLWPRQIITMLCDEAPVIEQGVEYLRIICFTYVLYPLTNALVAGQRSVQNVRIGMIASLVALFANLGLNYVLIFGHLGAPRMGTTGAAWATLVSRVLEFGILVVYTLCVDKKLAMRVRDFFRIDKSLLRDYFKAALPIVLSGGSWGIAMTFHTAILGHLGSIAVAANSVGSSISSLVMVFGYGAASASGVITGKTVGKGDRAVLREYVNTMQILFLIIGLFSGALLYVLKMPLLSFYKITEEALDLSNQFMNVLAVTTVGTAYQCSVLTGIVRGGGDTKFVLYNDLIAQWLIVVPISALAAFVLHWPSVWVFACLKSDQVFKCFVAVVKVNRYRWIKVLTRDDAAKET